MKAYNLYGINDLRYEDIEMPKYPNSDWVIVKVKACGICSSDIARIFTKGTYHFPTIPGHEFAGIVYSVANKKYDKLIGKHVGVFPLIPCKSCPQCATKEYEMCENYDYIGSRRDGGFAEYVAVPVWNLVVLSDKIQFKYAAMLEPLAVGIHSMKLGNVKKGQHVAIIGTGMIGICAGQCARIMGASSVTVFGRNESKRNIVEKCGLDYINQNSIDKIENEYDFVLEAVGSPESIKQSIQYTAPGGTLVLMGNPSDEIILPQNIYWRILRKQLTLKGSWNSSYDGKNTSDWTEAVRVLENKMIEMDSLLSHIFTKEKLMEGLELMKEHKEPYCKVMTIW